MLMMQDSEVVDKYVRKGVSISVLADLNCCKPEDVRKVLRDNGAEVPEPRKPKKEKDVNKEKEIKEATKAAAFDQVENIKKGADTSGLVHAPVAVREALTKEEIYLTELIDDCTKRINEIREFRKLLI